MPRPSGASSLGELAERVRPVVLARERRFPVASGLASLLPDGLPRGAAVTVTAAKGTGGAVTLALACAAGAGEAGFVAVVGMPELGAIAAEGLGLRFDRLVSIDTGSANPTTTAKVIAALGDGFDLVLLGPRVRLRPADGRRLVARFRERDAVLVVIADVLGAGLAAIRLRVTSSVWEGVEQTAGHLRARRAIVEADGRGAASRARVAELWLPDVDGHVRAVESTQHRASGSGGLVEPGRETPAFETLGRAG